MCRKLQMNRSFSLSASLPVAAANFPTLQDLSAEASLANFSFGQGELLCTPLMMANVYTVVHNGGLLNTPYVVKGKVQNGQIQEQPHSSKRVISAKTAKKLQQFLLYTVTNGTGKAAQCKGALVGGKTATAQTGKFEKKNEKLISYFVGIVNIKGDKLTVLLMKENGTSGSADCAPIFKEIVENIAKNKE